jgi:hypothetical protein
MAIARFRWGITFLALGLLFMLGSLDVIRFGFEDFWHVVGRIWPVLLIAIGIEKISSSTKGLKPLAFLSPLLIVGAFIFAVIVVPRSGGSGDWSIGYDRGSGSILTWSEPSSPSVKRLDLSVEKAGGRLVVRNGASSGSIIDSRLRYWGDKPKITSRDNGSLKIVHFEDRGHLKRVRDTWVLQVSDAVPVKMEIDGTAARMRLDFSGIQLEELNLNAGAVDIDLTFGVLMPVVNCVIECAAAALEITIPSGAGVSIDRESALSSFSAGGLSLVERGSVLETPDFEQQPVKINLRIESGLSTLRIHRSGAADPESSI